MVTQETSEAPTASPADPARGTPRYRLERAGIRNVWQYDDHVLDFAEGRLLLRGRNGAGKSKALEMLLPFLLDGDPRRLDTTGTNRTSLRWLMADDPRARSSVGGDGGPDLLGGPEESAQEGPGSGEAPDSSGEENGPPTRLGYLWVEFTTERGDRGLDGAEGSEPHTSGPGEPGREGAPPTHLTLGAAVTAVGEADPRCVFFVTDHRVGHDLDLVVDGRPKTRGTGPPGTGRRQLLHQRHRLPQPGHARPVRYRRPGALPQPHPPAVPAAPPHHRRPPRGRRTRRGALRGPAAHGRDRPGRGRPQHRRPRTGP